VIATVPTSLVGRTDELAALVAGVCDERRDATTWLIGGDAGVGKSRLIEELAATLADEEVTVVIGSCVHTAQSSLPFAAVTDAISRLRPHLDHDELQAELGGVDVLDRLAPEASGRSLPVEAGAIAVAGGSQLRMFEAVRRLLDGAGRRRRICVVLEDLHWADASTRDLLGYLATHLDGGRVTLVGTYRSDDLSRTHPFRPVLAELLRHPRVRHLSLAPFDRTELAEFATGCLGRPPSSRIVDELLERSGGNAFFATELLDAIEHGGVRVRPEVSELVLGRVERLSEPTRAVLRLLAVGGQSVPDELLALVADESDDVLDDALREAVEHQVIVVVDGDQLRFRHALMQEVVHATLLPRERRRAHARYAAALIGAPQLAACCGRHHAELAWHHREAGQLRDSLVASICAADDAMAVLGLAEALEHLVTAIEVWDDVDDPEIATGTTLCDLLRRAAEIAYRSGDGRAIQLQQAAIDESVDEPLLVLGPMYERLGRFLWNLGRHDDAESAYRRAVELLPSDPPTAELAQVLAGLGQMLMLTFGVEEGETTLSEALDVARAVGHRRIEGHALNSIGTVALHSGNFTDGVKMLEEALSIAVEVDDLEDRLRAHVNLGSGLFEMGDLEAAEQVCRQGIALADREGDSFAFYIESNLRQVLTEAGRWEEVLESYRSSRRPDGALADYWDLNFLPALEIRRGNVGAAQALLATHDGDALAGVDPQTMPEIWRSRAELALALGHTDEAARAVEEGLAMPGPLHQTLSLREMAVRIEAEAAATGDRQALDRARVHLAAIEQHVPGPGPLDGRIHRPGAVSAQASAHLATVDGRDDVDAWRLAVRRWDDAGFRWHAANARCWLAEALLRRGARDEARVTLDEAITAAEPIGARPVVDRARTLLRHAGLDDDAPRGTSGHAVALTDRELGVLRLVGEGRTNRQIGEELFISPKTVSVHVSRIFQKLRVENRTEAAAAARRAGIIT
jgi:DNA-binding CsgD family transcriptional regulator